jgi:hypothetical protein
VARPSENDSVYGFAFINMGASSMAEDTSESRIVRKLRAELWEGDPRTILNKVREILGEYVGHGPAVSEAVREEIYRMSSKITRLAHKISEHAREQERELDSIAEEVGKLAGQLARGERERGGRKRDDWETEGEEEKKKKEKERWRDKDDRDLA